MQKKSSLLSPVRHRKNERILAFVFMGVAAAMALYLFTSNAQAPLVQTPPCALRTLTGLYCPGCGTRSALIQLTGGNLYAAWRLNPLTILALPALFLFFMSQALTAFWGRSLARLYLHPAVAWTVFGLITAFWIMRNIPVYPFTLLQPFIVNFPLWLAPRG